MEQVIGSCSICGGDVRRHVGAWHVTIPPRPYCASCGAVASQGPVIPMVPTQTRRSGRDTASIGWAHKGPAPHPMFTAHTHQ